MSKISRNSLCPCGSGKKYKKCCLNQDQEKVIQKDESHQVKQKISVKEIEEFYAECDEIDKISNRVVDLIHSGNLEEAEKLGNELLSSYPDQIDGLERLAMVYEAQGNKEKACEYYNKTIEFAQSNDGFDPEFSKWALDKVKDLSS